jgi:hypothetical protein
MQDTNFHNSIKTFTVRVTVTVTQYCMVITIVYRLNIKDARGRHVLNWMEYKWTCIYTTKFINIKRFLRHTYRTNCTSTIKIKRTATHYTAALSTTTQTATKEHHTDKLWITPTTTNKTDDDQNGVNRVVIGSGCFTAWSVFTAQIIRFTGNHVPGYILTPVVADRKYPPRSTVTDTGAKYRCLQDIAHSLFFRRRS